MRVKGGGGIQEASHVAGSIVSLYERKKGTLSCFPGVNGRMGPLASEIATPLLLAA